RKSLSGTVRNTLPYQGLSSAVRDMTTAVVICGTSKRAATSAAATADVELEQHIRIETLSWVARRVVIVAVCAASPLLSYITSWISGSSSARFALYASTAAVAPSRKSTPEVAPGPVKSSTMPIR